MRILFSILVSIILTTNVAFAKGTEKEVNLVFNSVDIFIDNVNVNAKNIFYNGTIYLPIRQVSELLGFDVEYESDTNKVLLNSSDESNIENNGTSNKEYEEQGIAEFNSIDLYVNDLLIDAENILYKGTTYIPLRKVSDVTNVDLDYNSNDKTINLFTNGDNTSTDSDNNSEVNLYDGIVLKPMLTLDDITYPKEPKTIEDFDKVLLYMVNNNLTTLEVEYPIGYDFNDEFVENVSKSFGELPYRYIDYFSGITNLKLDALKTDENNILKLKMSSEFFDDETIISNQITFEEEAKRLNEYLYETGVLSDDMSEHKKAKVLYTYIILNTAYDTDDIETINPEVYTGYGTIENGTAVCQGYTALYNYMLKLNGIECYGQKGIIYKNKDPHIWTVAYLDGEKSYIDITFGDPAPDLEGYVDYDYFDTSKEFLELSRSGVE